MIIRAAHEADAPAMGQVGERTCRGVETQQITLSIFASTERLACVEQQSRMFNQFCL
jgi:hypothetical protein